jgi:hypothetical protein
LWPFLTKKQKLVKNTILLENLKTNKIALAKGLIA